MEYGYARVSTKEQNELRQLIALREFGLTDRAIFVDKQSGKDFDRRSYQRLLRKLKDGDTQLLSYVAQTEREFIHQRQAEGIAAAKARGVKFGRPRKVLPEGFGEVKARWERGELSARAAGKLLGVTHRSFLLWAQDDRYKEIVKKTQKVKRAG